MVRDQIWLLVTMFVAPKYIMSMQKKINQNYGLYLWPQKYILKKVISICDLGLNQSIWEELEITA